MGRRAVRLRQQSFLLIAYWSYLISAFKCEIDNEDGAIPCKQIFRHLFLVPRCAKLKLEQSVLGRTLYPVVSYSIAVLRHHEILQFVDFKDGGCPPSLNFEIEIFSSQLLRRHVLRYDVKFCERSVELLRYRREIRRDARLTTEHCIGWDTQCGPWRRRVGEQNQ